MNGLVHLYYGDGKGKTTAAIGLALRCAGHGQTVVIVQFLKDGASGECRALQTIQEIVCFAANPGGKFFQQMTPAEQTQTINTAQQVWRQATQYAVQHRARLLVLDEICAAIQYHLLPEQILLAFLDSRPAQLEVILTGRNPSDALLSRADYLTEMKNRRHPYEQGIPARKGIEY